MESDLFVNFVFNFVQISVISRTDSTDFPDCLPVLLSISVFFAF